MTSEELLIALKRPFDPRQISWRVGATKKDENQKAVSGIALAYIDSRDVMQRLDKLFGFNWQNKHWSEGKKTFCEIGLYIEGEWRWRAGGAGDTDVEAEKGAISDAFKRAAVLWGIGQYLYQLPNVWVPVKQHGKTVVLDGVPELPKWATPEGYDAILEKRKLDLLKTNEKETE